MGWGFGLLSFVGLSGLQTRPLGAAGGGSPGVWGVPGGVLVKELSAAFQVEMLRR